MPVVTGLRELAGGRVAVDLDGARWRTIPVEVAVRVRLGEGEVLDRPRLRELARELRRARGLDLALRALARRDQSAATLRRRLERRGVVASAVDEAVGRLEQAGIVDDERFASGRAESLAARGQGDEAIRWRLAREGVSEALAVRVVAALEPEVERARRLVQVRGAGARTARELARRGFGEAAVDEALGPLIAETG